MTRTLQLNSIGLLSPSQVAEFTVTSGALNSMNLINVIFDRLEDGDAFQNTDEFFWTLIQSKVKIITIKALKYNAISLAAIILNKVSE